MIHNRAGRAMLRCLFTLAICTMGVATSVAAAPRPNIVVILAESSLFPSDQEALVRWVTCLVANGVGIIGQCR